MIPARLRAGAQWSDVSILNISSRGMMIHSGRAGPEGSTVELHRGDYLIIARVVWREGARAGLRTDDRLPVEDIMVAGNTGSLRLVAYEGALVERRKIPRTFADEARIRGRLLEFAGVGAIALCLAFAIWALAEQALSGPMARIDAALSGHAEG